MIRRLARDAWKNMWSKVTTPENYIEGGCSFCKLAQEDCNICLLLKYFCEKENGKLKNNTLISNIRYARGYLLHTPSNIFYKAAMEIKFNECLKLIKRGVKDMMYFGKVRKKTEKVILGIVAE